MAPSTSLGTPAGIDAAWLDVQQRRRDWNDRREALEQCPQPAEYDPELAAYEFEWETLGTELCEIEYAETEIEQAAGWFGLDRNALVRRTGADARTLDDLGYEQNGQAVYVSSIPTNPDQRQALGETARATRAQPPAQQAVIRQQRLSLLTGLNRTQLRRLADRILASRRFVTSRTRGRTRTTSGARARARAGARTRAPDGDSDGEGGEHADLAHRPPALFRRVGDLTHCREPLARVLARLGEARGGPHADKTPASAPRVGS